MGNIDTNGWPPAPIAAQAATYTDQEVAEGQALFQAKGCTARCDADGMGTVAAPTLVDATQKYDNDYLDRWLENPAAFKPGSTMPALGLTGPEIEALLAYLHTLD